MAINKVEYYGNTLIDLTEDTVTPETLSAGVTAHNAKGEKITGTMQGGSGGVIVDGIPSNYAKVDYIQFNGNQAIDTGFICNQNTKIKVLFTRESSSSQYLYGIVSTGNTASFTAYIASGGSWRFGNKYISRTISVSDEIVRTAIVNKSGISHEAGTSSFGTVNDFETPGTLILGGTRQSGGGADAQFVGKVFGFEMWQDAELILKLVPVINASGVCRFYDTVSKTFFDDIYGSSFIGGNL